MSSFYICQLVSLFTKESFKGWGRKRTGLLALWLSKLFKRDYVLLEDGFIRSVSLGEEDSFSIVEDDIGIYYDATSPSRLEVILNNHQFTPQELDLAKEAICLIKKEKISKYNTGNQTLPSYLTSDNKKVLIIAQTKGDMSLQYGRAYEFDEKQMLLDAIKDNPNNQVYLKVHPAVLAGKKESSIDLEFAKKHCKIISEDIHPIVLLEVFEKVYTQTSQMGFEALLLGKEVVTYGMPFYAGWGLSIDRLKCERRQRKLSLEEVFAGAYILYTKYYNPYRKRQSDIIDTIREIALQRQKLEYQGSYDYLCIGDSHIRVFENPILRLLPSKFKVCYVAGATAYGIENIHSQTKAYYKFKLDLEQLDYKNIIVTLGEVDISYTLWKLHFKRGKPIEEYLDISLSRYKSFLNLLRNYGKVYVISNTIPTVKGGTSCDDEISGIRESLDISYSDKIRLNQSFNQNIQQWCDVQKDIIFIDTNRYIFNKDKIKSIYLPLDKCDHHYNRYSFALLLSYLFFKGKFND